MPETHLSALELAGLLGVDRRTLYRWVESGRLTAGRTLTQQLIFDPAQVRQDYERAGAVLPPKFAAHLKTTAAKPRAETRGAA